MIMKKTRHLSCQNGLLEGVYINAGKNTALVIIANGHNGFYNYGMFPHIQEKLFEKGISSFSFNYSHGGVEGDNDLFTRLDLYEKNCMRLEKEDILFVLKNAHGGQFGEHNAVFILTHSLGGVPTVFAARESSGTAWAADGIILVSAVSKLNFWPETTISQWKETGVYPIRNNRTQQELPQGPEFLSEILAADGEWNVEQAVRSLTIPICVLHAADDEAVPLIHGTSLYDWCGKNNPANHFESIAGAGHTFNTRHPFAGPTPELEELIGAANKWIKDNC
jgi:hypothetical protein